MEFNATIDHPKIKCKGDYISFPLNSPSSFSMVCHDTESKDVIVTYRSREFLMTDYGNGLNRVDGFAFAESYLNPKYYPKSSKPNALSLPTWFSQNLYYQHLLPFFFIDIFQNNVIGIGNADDALTQRRLFDKMFNVRLKKSTEYVARKAKVANDICKNSLSFGCFHVGAINDTDLRKTKKRVYIRKNREYNVLVQHGFIYPTNIVFFLTMTCHFNFDENERVMTLQSSSNEITIFKRDDLYRTNNNSAYFNLIGEPVLMKIINFFEMVEIDNPNYGEEFYDGKLVSVEEENDLRAFLRDNSLVQTSTIRDIWFKFGYRGIQAKKITWSAAFGICDGFSDTNENCNNLCKIMLAYRRRPIIR